MKNQNLEKVMDQKKIQDMTAATQKGTEEARSAIIEAWSDGFTTGVEMATKEALPAMLKALSESDNRIPQLLTIDDTAEALAVSRRTVYNLINNGDLQQIQITDNMKRISADDLQNFIESKKKG